MNIPLRLDINEFNYELPVEKIAKYPLPDRDNSKLLLYHESNIKTYIFKELPQLIDRNSQLIFNDTKVLPARLKFKKKTGSNIEVFLLEPYDPGEYTLSFSTHEECSWICLIGNAKKWKNEPLVKNFESRGKTVSLEVFKKERIGNKYVVLFRWNNDRLSFSEIISCTGQIPIPPYLNREAEPEDLKRYQTIYSQYEGSVAAPTAGLHFTEKILSDLDEKGIQKTHLTLHVGAGTFIPVKTEDAMLHEMHTEHIFSDHQSIENLYHSGNKYFAVGTTSVRAMETLYYIGLKIEQKMPEKGMLFLDQWESYKYQGNISRKKALGNILKYMDKYKLDKVHITTKMMIVPGYDFRMTDGLLTNFHQPKSTLLLLVAAFTGTEWKKIYDHALNNQFRFLSYGDSSLIIK